jgi:intein-encoded DNA endonuclease-like protein
MLSYHAREDGDEEAMSQNGSDITALKTKVAVVSKVRKRGKYVPREIRIRAYNDAHELRRRGLSYDEIRNELHRKYGVWIPVPTIIGWLSGKHDPRNGRRIPSLEMLEPSEDLAYTIGVTIGDGSTPVICDDDGYEQGVISLAAKDKEFVEEAAMRLARVLNRQPPKIYYDEKSGRYYFRVYSQTLYELLKKPIDVERIRRYVEHCEKCMAAFLRGFFDSEGDVTLNGEMRVANSNYHLLEYVRWLLKMMFDIETTEPKPVHRRGSLMCVKGKQYVRRRDVYRIRVQARSALNFYRRIGFTISRKQERLEEYLRRTGKL